jgi:disulfide bond formation protein DsbB
MYSYVYCSWNATRNALRQAWMLKNKLFWCGQMLAALLALAGALAVQHVAGLQPCTLCILQRWPHGAAIMLCLLVLWVIPRCLRAFALVLALLHGVGASLGLYQSLVEWNMAQLPPWFSCGAGLPAGGLAALLNTKPVVCDVASVRVLGLSMAGVNTLFSLGLALWAVVYSWHGTRDTGNVAGKPRR